MPSFLNAFVAVQTMILTLGTTPAVQRTMVFDTFALDKVNRAVHVHDHAAGKAVNAARVVHALGEEVIALGFQGGDSGELCRRELDSIGVRHEFIEVAVPTRTCISLIDESQGTTTELVEETGPVEASKTDELYRMLEKYLSSAALLVVAGTLAPGVPEDFYARCVKLANDHHVATIVDAKGEAIRLAIAQHPTFIKPNRGELQATVGTRIETDGELIEAMKRLTSQGATHVVVTDGPAQTIHTDGIETKVFQMPKIKAINPIGSGDAFAAGLAVGWVRNQSPVDCVRLGIACGVANAMTMYSGHVEKHDVEQILDALGKSE